ncbi:Adipocyte plasma membrane-associated protein-like protein [Dinothrombium tinctorium]|uniref:Adipocyte plasma membrane-associated protein-like protein n=1 Tax=Dinothrombium tinctorium TaxID=1965070 RepID=A0A443RQ04_9ACAR|nr:Adipocyte plasma membrane-associated protein-like protein [Dinothrombium tinctorium]
MIYSGTIDGRIVRIDEKRNTTETIARLIEDCENNSVRSPRLFECGRPLGLKFDEKGTLYVIDAFYGLWSLENVYLYPNSEIIKNNLLSLRDVNVGCRRSMQFDDLLIDGNIIYISDVSGKWDLASNVYATIEPETNGRILKFDLKTRKVEELINNLWNPKGLEITDDKEAILICESTKRRVLKYYIRGGKTGKSEVFSDSLPGEPENIRRGATTSTETFWITFSSARTTREPSYGDYLTDYPSIRLVIARFFYAIGSLIQFVGNAFAYAPLTELGNDFITGKNPVFDLLITRNSMVAELDYQGLIVSTYHSSKNELQHLTEAREVLRDGQRFLYLGSNTNNFIAKLTIEPREIEMIDKLRFT